MFASLKRLMGIDERLIEAEKVHQEKVEDFDEANKKLEELQARLDGIGKKTQKKCEDMSRTLSALSERPPLESEPGDTNAGPP